MSGEEVPLDDVEGVAGQEVHPSDVADVPNPQNKELWLPEFAQQKFNIKEPWQKGMDYGGYNLDTSNPEIKAQIGSISAVEHTPNPVITAAKGMTNAAETVASIGLDTLQIPVHMGSGLYARTSNMVTPYVAKDKSIAAQALDKFVNPPEIQDLRNKYAYDFGTADGFLNKMEQEIAPELLPSQVMSDLTKDRMFDFIGNSIGKTLDIPTGVIPKYSGKLTEEIIGPEGKKALKDFTLNVGFDPLMWTEIFPSFAGTVEKAAKDASTTESLNSAADKAYKGKPMGMAAQAERGEKALFAIKVPFTDYTIAKYKGIKTLQQLDDFTAYANNVISRTPFRVLSQRTSFPEFDMAFTGKGLRDAADNIDAHALMNNIDAQGLNTERISRLAKDIREFGSENRAMLKGQEMGANYTYDELELAAKRNDLIHQYIDDGLAKWNKVTGDNISRDDFFMRNLSDADKQKYISDMEASGVNIKRITINGEDFTFSKAYDGGRELNQGMLNTPEGRRARNVFESSNKQSKFYTAPSSSMERNALSTDAMNSAFNQLGYKEGEAFNPNDLEAIINKGLERRKAANNLEFVDYSIKNYGVKTPLEAEEIIKEANQRILSGTPTAEDLMLSKMKTTDFVLPSKNVTSKLKAIYGEENLTSLEAGNTFFPRDVARKFENILDADPSKDELAKALSDYQRLMSKNMLTSLKRIPKQFIDNVSRMSALRAMPEFLQETAMTLAKTGKDIAGKLLKKDWGKNAELLDVEARSIPAITENAWNLKEFSGPIKVNSKMIKDPELRDSYYSWLEKLHDGVKFNKQNELLGFVKDNSGKWVKSTLHPTDNIISSWIRDVGNGSDNIARRALYKKYREQGYNIQDAVNLVQRGLMDFQNTDKALKGMRYISPFASFHIKNLESLPVLISINPGLANVLRPDEKGYLYKYIMDWRGWDPKDSRLLEKMNPINHHSLYFGLMKGKDHLIANQGIFDNYLNKYMEAGLTDAQKGKMDGNVISFNVPTYLEAAFGFADFKNTLSSPFTKALVAMNGVDPFTGNDIKNYGLGIKNIYAAAAEVNPLNYPKFYNEVVMPEVAKFKPELIKSMQRGVLGPAITDILKIKFGDGPLAGVNLDEQTIKTMTNDKFLGLANIDLLDMNYIYYQKALIKSQKEIIDQNGGSGTLFEGLLKSGKNREVLAILKQLKSISADIADNTKLYFELRKKYPKGLAPDEAQAAKMTFDDAATGYEQVPQDESSPNEEVPSDDVNDTSISKPLDRMPADVAGEKSYSIKDGKFSIDNNGKPIPGLSDLWNNRYQELKKPGMTPKDQVETIGGLYEDASKRDRLQNPIWNLDAIIKNAEKHGEDPHEAVKKAYEELQQNIAQQNNQDRSPAGNKKEPPMSDMDKWMKWAKSVPREVLNESSGKIIKNHLKTINFGQEPTATQAINSWKRQDNISENYNVKRISDMDSSSLELFRQQIGAYPNSKNVTTHGITAVREDGTKIIYMKDDYLNSDGHLTNQGMASLRHEYEHLSDIYNQRKLNGKGTKSFGSEEYHHSRYKEPFEYSYPYQLWIKDQLKDGKKIDDDILKKAFFEGITPTNLIKNDNQDRSPASAAKDLETQGGMGGGSFGSALGAVGTLGAAATMMGGGAQDTESGLGSNANKKVREYRTMPIEQLLEQTGSKEKDSELEYRGFNVDPKKAEKRGYNLLLQHGQNYPTNYDDVTHIKNVKDLPGYFELGLESLDENYKGDPHFPGKRRAWTRGFSVNPEEVLIIESQANRNDKERFKMQREAIRETIEYAKRSGYKKIGLISSDAAMRVEGHEDVLASFKDVYDNIGPNVLKKSLGQSVEKTTGPKFDYYDYMDAVKDYDKYANQKIKESESLDPRLQWLVPKHFEKDSKNTLRNIGNYTKKGISSDRLNYRSYNIEDKTIFDKILNLFKGKSGDSK